MEQTPPLWQVRERLEKHPEIKIMSLDSDKRKETKLIDYNGLHVSK